MKWEYFTDQNQVLTSPKNICLVSRKLCMLFGKTMSSKQTGELGWVVAGHTFKFSTLEAEAGGDL